MALLAREALFRDYYPVLSYLPTLFPLSLGEK